MIKEIEKYDTLMKEYAVKKTNLETVENRINTNTEINSLLANNIRTIVKFYTERVKEPIKFTTELMSFIENITTTKKTILLTENYKQIIFKLLDILSNTILLYKEKGNES